MQPRTLALATLAAAAAAGLALGAASQKEVILVSDAPDGSIVAGNLVTVTALLPALAVGLGGWLLAARRRDTVVPALGMATAVYVLVWLVQSQFPVYHAESVRRTASLALNPLVNNQPAIGSVLLPVLALVVAAVLLFGLSARALLQPRPWDASANGLMGRHVAANALSVPFLAVGAAGCLRLLMVLPEQRDSAPYLLVLPAAALACLGLAVTQAIKTHHLAGFLRNPHLAPSADEAWRGIGRAEGAGAVVASFLRPFPSDALEAGLTFGMTARSHVQALVLLAAPLAPLLVVHRQALTAFAGPTHRSRDDWSFPWLLAGGAAAFVGAGVATFLLDGALWPWLFAAVPMALLALRAPPVHAAPSLLVLAIVLWGIGNTFQASFDGRALVGEIAYNVDPGLLALARLAGAAVFSLALARALASLRPDLRPRTLWPLAVGTAVLCSSVLLLELPMQAWVEPDPDVIVRVGVGSMVASQDPPVQAVIHSLAVGAAAVAGWLAARLLLPLRPWRRAVPVTQRPAVPSHQ